jgi:hypothetical protein
VAGTANKPPSGSGSASHASPKSAAGKAPGGKSPLREFHPPDHAGGSIVNLMSSLVRAAGGQSPHRELDPLPARRLSDAKHIVYLMVDGLGAAQVERHLAKRRGRLFFAAHTRHELTTVFPSTTATAVTTFATGSSPAEHGILGWHVHLPDLGMVSTVLLGTTRNGTPMAPGGFDYDRYFRIPSYLESVRRRKVCLTYGDIARRPFNQALTKWDHVSGYQSLAGMSRRIVQAARSRHPSLVYAYWPRYDALCHTHGPAGTEPAEHFDELDKTLARLLDKIRGLGAVLCVCADHGFDEVPKKRMIDLYKNANLRRCLATAPSGDPRQVSCHVRPGTVKEFRRIVQEELGEACVCVSDEQLLEAGVFGKGERHTELRRRLGDFTLLARPGWAFGWNPPGLEAEHKRGNHGGMTAHEMRVPLYVVYA